MTPTIASDHTPDPDDTPRLKLPWADFPSLYAAPAPAAPQGEPGNGDVFSIGGVKFALMAANPGCDCPSCQAEREALAGGGGRDDENEGDGEGDGSGWDEPSEPWGWGWSPAGKLFGWAALVTGALVGVAAVVWAWGR